MVYYEHTNVCTRCHLYSLGKKKSESAEIRISRSDSLEISELAENIAVSASLILTHFLAKS